ncbi:hypothetical protein GGS20DRAFT_540723 [Poronia punctata]|nr:hypothetical protein GGS20DRAFT_540723 [Poronia punctata]
MHRRPYLIVLLSVRVTHNCQVPPAYTLARWHRWPDIMVRTPSHSETHNRRFSALARILNPLKSTSRHRARLAQLVRASY